jgi:bifunctional enzyme CysN/CysC
MNVVIVGHVDHGKSTLVGRLLADTGVLGDGKLEKVVETCRQQGKVFEYAFLLDALEEEQGQGITIDAARVFFRTDLRDYIIIDAPGHVEFLKNMVTGAARAEAALLLIDANEGVRENSRRHGYLLSMLGIRQVVVAVNKIDLVDYSREVFDRIEREYRAFLAEVGIEPLEVIPVSAREGDQIAGPSARLGWFDGPSILEALDALGKQPEDEALPLRFPVQDVYKFNHRGDDRRIIAGRVESGSLAVGDDLLFSPSGKRSKVASIEAFSADPGSRVAAGTSTGITLTEQIYVSRGELVSRVGEPPPSVSTRLRVNLFWLGRRPMVPSQRYKLKLATAEVEATIDEVVRVIDASAETRGAAAATEVERHQVAELILRTRQPVAFDASADLEATGRFVIVDGYDIAGGGIVREVVSDALEQQRLESRIRASAWVGGDVSAEQRRELNGHPASMVMLTGGAEAGKHDVARTLEAELARGGHHTYLLDGQNVYLGVDADLDFDDVDELVRRFGEVAHLMLDAGLLVVSTTNVIGLADHLRIATQIAPFKMFVVHLGPEAEGLPEGADLRFDPDTDPQLASRGILAGLRERGRLRSTTSRT